jgi:hypothetical protein
MINGRSLGTFKQSSGVSDIGGALERKIFSLLISGFRGGVNEIFDLLGF